MRALFLTLALILTPLAAHAQDNPIVARIQALIDAYNTGDLAALGSIYTEDAALFPPGEAPIVGRENIVQHYADALAQGASDVQFRVLDIRATDAMAVATIDVSIQAGPQRVLTRSMHVWQVFGDDILLSRDIYQILGTQ